MEAAALAAEDQILDCPGLDWVTPREIEAAYSTAKRQEAQLYNADGDPRKSI